MTAPTVVVLHGLARTHRSVQGMVRALQSAGFRTWSESYPSRIAGVHELADALAHRIAREAPGELMAVTHSLGGVLLRQMADTLPWRRAVLVAPPNHGSKVARTLRANALFQWFYGPAGQQVAEPLPWPLPPEPYAIIAGSKALSLSNPTSWLTRGARIFTEAEPSDGTVLVDETRLPTAAAFAIVDETHTKIMDHPQTQRLAVEFLRNGRFEST